jgi:hypothetical protein
MIGLVVAMGHTAFRVGERDVADALKAALDQRQHVLDAGGVHTLPPPGATRHVNPCWPLCQPMLTGCACAPTVVCPGFGILTNSTKRVARLS